tara:strand:+ start:109 stop:303 length:195 start_codon:yes stop_codon:yes gene_type:complete
MAELSSTQSAQVYELLQPEIELFLDKNNYGWVDLVDDPTAWTQQEAIETSVRLFMSAVRSSLGI